MKAIDLTHIITEDMPVYPGTEPPKLTPANSYERDGFKETLLSLYTHTGTHIDPPAISCSLTWAGTGFGGRRRISATIPALTMRPSAL